MMMMMMMIMMMIMMMQFLVCCTKSLCVISSLYAPPSQLVGIIWEPCWPNIYAIDRAGRRTLLAVGGVGIVSIAFVCCTKSLSSESRRLADG
jgi:hypothetical protein